MENVDDFNTLTQSNDYLRVKIPDAIRVMDEEDKTIVTYKYFTGTAGVDGKDAPHYYIQKDPETVYKLTNGLMTEDQLTEEQKKPYNEKAEADKKRYEEEKKKYEAKKNSEKTSAKKSAKKAEKKPAESESESEKDSE